VATGHTAIATGAIHGIGAGRPPRLRDQRAQDAAAVVSRIRDGGGKVAAVEADLSDPATPGKLFDTAEEQFGPDRRFTVDAMSAALMISEFAVATSPGEVAEVIAYLSVRVPGDGGGRVVGTLGPGARAATSSWTVPSSGISATSCTRSGSSSTSTTSTGPPNLQAAAS
jgi:hypothetical protein